MEGPEASGLTLATAGGNDGGVPQNAKPSRRSTKAERRAETTEQILDAAEYLFSRHGLYGVTGAVFDEAFPAPESGPFGGDRHATAVDLPRDLIAGADVERVADFLRDCRLALAGNG